MLPLSDINLTVVYDNNAGPARLRTAPVGDDATASWRLLRRIAVPLLWIIICGLEKVRKSCMVGRPIAKGAPPP